MQNILKSLTPAPGKLRWPYVGFCVMPYGAQRYCLRGASCPAASSRRGAGNLGVAEHDRRQPDSHHPLGERHRSEQVQRRDHRLSTVSRNHAVLTRYDDGSWTITDAGSKDGTLVNGRKVQICALKPKDRISIGIMQ